MSCGYNLLSNICSKGTVCPWLFNNCLINRLLSDFSCGDTGTLSLVLFFNYLNFLWRWLSHWTLLFVRSFHKAGQFIPGPTAEVHSRVSLLEDIPPTGKPTRTQSISIPILDKNATQHKGALRPRPDSLVLNFLLFCSLRHQQLLVICNLSKMQRGRAATITFFNNIPY